MKFFKKTGLIGLAVFMMLSGCAERDKQLPLLKIDPPGQTASGEATASDLASDNEEDVEAKEVSPRALYFDGDQSFTQTAKRRIPNFSETNDGFTLNFSNADIRVITQAVLGDMLSQPYLVHPSVQGTLSLQSSGPVSTDALLYVYEEALQTRNYALIDVNGVFNIVPFAEAPQSVTSIRRTLPPSVNIPGFGVQIVPLKYTTPTEIAKVLQPFSSQGSILSVDDARGLVIIAGSSQELATMLQTIETFDVNWMEGMSFAMYRLNYVEPQSLTDELLQIFGGSGSPITGMIRLIPIPRLNSILGISSQPQYLREVEEWINRLDLGEGTPGRRIYIYQAKNGRAADLADGLNSILTNEPARNSNDQQGLQLGNQQSQANNGVSEETSSNAFEAGGLKIVPNEETNSLLILATPSEYGVLERTLAQMDLPPRQVLIEATLAEVMLDDDLNFGVQWFFQTGDNSFTLSDAANGAVNSQFPGFSYVFSGSSDARTVLNTIASMTDVRVISSPKLMVLNNQSARLQVGDQVPIVTQSAVSINDGNAPLVNTVQLRDTGVILEVTPRIGEDGAIMLDITQEVSDVVATTTSGIDSPTIRQRMITSSVVIQDGETLALGGIIRETVSDADSGVPVLKDIPFLGKLFSNTNQSTRRTELIILITPRIARDARETREILEYLSGQFKNVFANPEE